MINFDYSKPASVDTAIDKISKDQKARMIAGGTNLVDLMKRNVESTEKLIDITALPLRQIERKNGILSIGALVSNNAVADNDIVKKEFPLLSLAIKAGASPQLRNMATVGGNIMQRTRCSYFYDTAMPCNKRSPGTGCGAYSGYNRMHAIFGTSDQCIAVHPSDMCVGLAALDATVIVQHKKGTRRIPFLEFHRLPGNEPQKDNTLMPGELITSIEIKPAVFQQKVYYLKIRDRSSYAFALVSAAVGLQMNGDHIQSASIALGGVAHKPWRLTAVEQFLQGKIASMDTFQQAAAMSIVNAKTFGENH